MAIVRAHATAMQGVQNVAQAAAQDQHVVLVSSALVTPKNRLVASITIDGSVQEATMGDCCYAPDLHSMTCVELVVQIFPYPDHPEQHQVELDGQQVQR